MRVLLLVVLLFLSAVVAILVSGLVVREVAAMWVLPRGLLAAAIILLTGPIFSALLVVWLLVLGFTVERQDGRIVIARRVKRKGTSSGHEARVPHS